ncbi:MAG TPA: biotin/lipoyl-containing protein [Candidatus Tumulicola sp.]|nr:biotin/lipoyl-containing protein [Candidatus Tumulicola sp.]
MDLNKKILDQLVELMQRDGLDRLRVRVGDLDLDLRMSLPHAAESSGSAAASASAAGSQHATKTDEAPPGVRKVLAPLVGVFYRAPAPSAKLFVENGDSVSAGQVLCILEAMKLMNEIVSEYDGTVVKVCAKDGELVSLHQELFWIGS